MLSLESDQSMAIAANRSRHVSVNAMPASCMSPPTPSTRCRAHMPNEAINRNPIAGTGYSADIPSCRALQPSRSRVRTAPAIAARDDRHRRSGSPNVTAPSSARTGLAKGRRSQARNPGQDRVGRGPASSALPTRRTVLRGCGHCLVIEVRQIGVKLVQGLRVEVDHVA